MENEVLADIEQEGKKLKGSDEEIIDLLNETDELELSPADSPSEEEKTEDADPSEEGEKKNEDDSNTNTPDENNVPFHKHPRWKQMQDDNVLQKQQNEELQKTLQQLQENQESANKDTQPLPPEWTALYGDDETSRKAYTIQQKQFSDMEARIIENSKKAQTDAEAAQKNQQKQYDEWVSTELQSLTDAGEKFDRNKLLKVAVDMQPTDDSGNISFKKALQIYRLQEQKPDKTVNKQVAAKTASNNQGDGKVSVSPSTNTLRHKSMQSLAQE